MSSGSTPSGNITLFPTDLVFVGTLGLFLIAIGLGYSGEFPGRVAVGLVAILFAPGYALVSSLFPKKNSQTAIFEDIRIVMAHPEGRVTAVERLLLAIGLSVGLVPLIGLGLDYSPRGIDSSRLLISTGAVTIVLTLAATVRRLRMPPAERFDPKISRFVRTTFGQLRTVQARSTLSLVLIIGLLIAAGGIGFAVLDADRGEQFTSLYLLSEDPETGELIAGEYPEEITQGETENVTIGVTNNEGKQVDYVVVAQLQSVNETGEIEDTHTMDRFTVTLQPGETWERPHTIHPELTGNGLRMTYFVFADEPPETPVYRPADAYRTTHIWIDVPAEN